MTVIITSWMSSRCLSSWASRDSLRNTLVLPSCQLSRSAGSWSRIYLGRKNIYLQLIVKLLHIYYIEWLMMVLNCSSFSLFLNLDKSIKMDYDNFRP